MAKFITFRSKTKAIQADLGIFMDIPTYSGIFITLCSAGIFRTLVAYSEPWYIQNPVLFKILVYSDPWNIQNPVKHLRWSILRKYLTVIIIFAISAFHVLSLVKKCVFFNTYLIFTPEAFFQCKKVWGLRGPGALNFLYIYLLMYSNKLAYLQLITVLVCGSSPWKKVMNKVT